MLPVGLRPGASRRPPKMVLLSTLALRPSTLHVFWDDPEFRTEGHPAKTRGPGSSPRSAPVQREPGAWPGLRGRRAAHTASIRQCLDARLADEFSNRAGRGPPRRRAE